MITIIHGDDTAASRNLLYELKEKNPQAVTLFGPTIDLTTLAQIFQSDSLFGSPETLFIEDLLTSKKQSSDFDAILSYLTTQSPSNTIYIWEGKEVTKTMLTKLQAQSRLFKLPQSLFQFLDSLAPGNATQALTLFHKTIETSEAELVFFMLIRQFRLLLSLSADEAMIDETKRIAPWQKGKLTKQARLFSPSQLITLYQELHEIDVNSKTGGSPLPLSSSIDIFLMNL